MRCHHGLLPVLTLLAACGGNEQAVAYDLNGRTMGTTFHITLIAPPAETDLDQVDAGIHATLERIENLASTYRSGSEISRFNADRSAEWVQVTAEFCELVSAAIAVSEISGGAFDITVAPLVNLWGFGPDFQEDSIPTDGQIAAAIRGVGYEHLQTDCVRPAIKRDSSETRIDLSGWAKGYAVDEVAALLDTHKVERYLVEIGGEMRLRGRNAEGNEFAIAIEKPLENKDMEYSVVHLTDASVATSGDYRNFFEIDGTRYSHTINPRTGRPIEHQLTGVTVVSDSTAYADAMATALLVLGPEEGTKLAERLGITSYFLVRSEPGLTELSVAGFDQLRTQ